MMMGEETHLLLDPEEQRAVPETKSSFENPSTYEKKTSSTIMLLAAAVATTLVVTL
jgi:hypothetical protein